MYKSYALSKHFHLHSSNQPLHKYVTRLESPVLLILNTALAALPVIDKVSSLGTSIYSSYAASAPTENEKQQSLGKLFEDEASTIKNVASVSLSGYFLSKLTAYTIDAFIQKHGETTQSTIDRLLKSGWNFMTSVNPKYANIKREIKSHVEHNKVEKNIGTAEEEQTWISSINNIQDNNKSLLLLVVGGLATFLHSLGALEMQKQIQTPLLSDAENAIDNENHENQWVQSEEDILKSTYEKKGFLQQKTENLSVNKQLRDIYQKSDFYTKQSGYSTGLPKISDFSLIRIVFNLLVGLSVEIRTILGIVHYQNNDGNEKKDHITFFSQWVNMIFYWEILAHMLKIHGWAPLYIALQQIAQILKFQADITTIHPTESKQKNDINSKPQKTFGAKFKKRNK